MKRKLLFIAIIVMIGLMFSTMQVMAAPEAPKPTPDTLTRKNKEAGPEEKGVEKGKARHFKGTVTAKTAASLTLALKDGTSVNLVIDKTTQVQIPTVKDATVDQINLNVQAVVLAKADGAGALVVQKILIVPGKPVRFHRVGLVTAYTAGASITIQDKAGETFTFILGAPAKILPKELASTLAPGVKVTIISRRDPTGGPLTAQGIVIHEKGGD